MHEFVDERPIPLGRAAVAAPPAPAAEPPQGPIPAAAPTPPAAAPVPRPVAHIERTRPRAAPEIRESGPPPAVAIAATGPARAAAVDPPVVGRVALGPRAARGQHPMAGLGGFRMEVELVQDGGRARDVGRFLVAYIVVVALVLGLVVAYLALNAHVGSGGA